MELESETFLRAPRTSWFQWFYCSIQIMNPVHTLISYYLGFILVFFSHLPPDTHSGLFHLGSLTKICMHFSCVLRLLHILSSKPPWFQHPKNVRRGLKRIKFLVMHSLYFSVVSFFFHTDSWDEIKKMEESERKTARERNKYRREHTKDGKK